MVLGWSAAYWVGPKLEPDELGPGAQPHRCNLGMVRRSCREMNFFFAKKTYEIFFRGEARLRRASPRDGRLRRENAALLSGGHSLS